MFKWLIYMQKNKKYLKNSVLFNVKSFSLLKIYIICGYTEIIKWYI